MAGVECGNIRRRRVWARYQLNPASPGAATLLTDLPGHSSAALPMTARGFGWYREVATL